MCVCERERERERDFYDQRPKPLPLSKTKFLEIIKDANTRPPSHRPTIFQAHIKHFCHVRSCYCGRQNQLRKKLIICPCLTWIQDRGLNKFIWRLQKQDSLLNIAFYSCLSPLYFRILRKAKSLLNSPESETRCVLRSNLVNSNSSVLNLSTAYHSLQEFSHSTS